MFFCKAGLTDHSVLFPADSCTMIIRLILRLLLQISISHFKDILSPCLRYGDPSPKDTHPSFYNLFKPSVLTGMPDSELEQILFLSSTKNLSVMTQTLLFFAWVLGLTLGPSSYYAFTLPLTYSAAWRDSPTLLSSSTFFWHLYLCTRPILRVCEVLQNTLDG